MMSVAILHTKKDFFTSLEQEIIVASIKSKIKQVVPYFVTVIHADSEMDLEPVVTLKNANTHYDFVVAAVSKIHCNNNSLSAIYPSK